MKLRELIAFTVLFVKSHNVFANVIPKPYQYHPRYEDPFEKIGMRFMNERKYIDPFDDVYLTQRMPLPICNFGDWPCSGYHYDNPQTNLLRADEVGEDIQSIDNRRKYAFEKYP